MKILGHASHGGTIVSLDDIEHRTLQLLARVASGNSIGALEPRNYPSDIDLQPALTAVKYWIMAKDNANQLRNLANEIDNILRHHE